MSYNSTACSAPAPGEAKEGSIRVAAIQMSAGPNINGNLEEAARLLAIAASQGAKLAALPEYFCLMGMKDADRVAARERIKSGPIQQFMSSIAKRLGIWIEGDTVTLDSYHPDMIRISFL